MANQTANNDVQMGCKLCRLLNDGWCQNYCMMDKQQRKALTPRIKAALAQRIPANQLA